jgi:hypothetical protein
MSIAQGAQQRSSVPLAAGAAEGWEQRIEMLEVPRTPAAGCAPEDGAPGDPDTAVDGDEDSDEEFVIEKVLGERLKAGSTEYKIKWLGDHPNSWEPEENVNQGAIDVWRGWDSETADHGAFEEHPMPPASHPDWRKKEAVATLKSAKPKFTTRLTDDEDEAMGEKTVNSKKVKVYKPEWENNKGWEAKQLKHKDYLKFQKMAKTMDYKPGSKLQLSESAKLVAWIDHWIPKEAWLLELEESNRYADRCIADLKAKGSAVDDRVQAYINRGGFTVDSLRCFYLIQLLCHGLHGIKYDIVKCWSDDPLYEINWVKRMPVEYFLAHARFCHYEDNFKIADPDNELYNDVIAKTRGYIHIYIYIQCDV